MNIGIIGTGAVGTACAFATVMRGFASSVVLIERDRKRARGVVTDLQYGAVFCFIARRHVNRR
jgi:L-lactate dehydrogenase